MVAQRQPSQQMHRVIVQIPVGAPTQPSSSSTEDPMQVNIPSPHPRISEDDEDARAMRPRLDMNALISELCERDVPETDWEKLSEISSSARNKYTHIYTDIFIF